MSGILFQAGIGLLAGTLGGLLGIGGSILIIPGMVLYLSHTSQGYSGSAQHLIQAAAMICNVCAAAPAAVVHSRAGAVLRPVVALLIPSALLGILLGVTVSNSSSFARENGVYLAMLLAAFLVYVAGYNTMRLLGKTDLQAEFDEDRRASPLAVVAVGLPMGFVAGLLGIGGGILCVPMQQVLLRMPLRRAIANSTVTIVFVSLVGAIHKNATLPSNGVEITASLSMAAMLVPTVLLGSYMGGRLTHILPRKVIRIVLIAFMLVAAWLTFSRAWQTAHGPKEAARLRRPMPPVGRPFQAVSQGRWPGKAVLRARATRAGEPRRGPGQFLANIRARARRELRRSDGPRTCLQAGSYARYNRPQVQRRRRGARIQQVRAEPMLSHCWQIPYGDVATAVIFDFFQNWVTSTGPGPASSQASAAPSIAHVGIARGVTQPKFPWG